MYSDGRDLSTLTLTILNSPQLHVLSLHHLSQIFQIVLQTLNLGIIELSRLCRSLSTSQPYQINPQSTRVKPHLLNIKPCPDINKYFLPIRQFPLNIQRTCQRHQNLILPICPLSLRPLDAIVDRAHAVLELGLRGAELRVRGC